MRIKLVIQHIVSVDIADDVTCEGAQKALENTFENFDHGHIPYGVQLMLDGVDKMSMAFAIQANGTAPYSGAVPRVSDFRTAYNICLESRELDGHNGIPASKLEEISRRARICPSN